MQLLLRTISLLAVAIIVGQQNDSTRVAIFRAKRHLEEAVRLLELAARNSSDVLPFSPDMVISSLREQARQLDRAINPIPRAGEPARALEPKFESEKIFVEPK